jgi:aryl-alcohol dehydrogenase-like predicted oxidoreductase
MEDISRRNFIKGVVGACVLPAVTDGFANIAQGLPAGNPYDAKGLPTTFLGSSGVEIPRIVLGLGSRFCHIDTVEESDEMLNYALDNGFYYWDTAHIYDNSLATPPGKTKSPEHIVSEVRVGEVIKYRRKEVFLSTKVTAREPSGSMREIEDSLKRLNTDHLDMLKVHDVQSLDDVDWMSRKGHLIDILCKLKEEGVTRFIGFSGHGDADALVEMTKRAPFDSMLVAMNHWRQGTAVGQRQEKAIPAGKTKKMGVLLMKAVRPKETIPGLNAPDLVRYALSLDGPDAVVIGMDSVAVVQSNLEILRDFKKLPPGRMQELAMQLEPFYRHENLPWMQDNYVDGMWNQQL